MIPFKLATTIIPQKEVKLKARFFPKENDTIKTKTGNLSLSKKISEGGEGIIYTIKENKSIVCKIYHPEKLTNLKKEKIELMISKKISFEGICWPIDIVLNSHDEFVGYVMPAASGKTMQTSMFIKPQLLKNFPHFTRKDLASIAISFLHKMDFLHSMNIIVGDINALNILVEPNGKIWFVDTDSYQIENFPCPVGTVNFTAPEIQGRDYADFLRTKNHELFAIATMVFMILFPGKPPYSQQGGESQSDNIKKMNFPYWCSEKAEVNPPEVLKQRYGLIVSRRKLQRTLKYLNLKVKMKRRFKVITTTSNHTLPISPNHLNRDFYSSQIDKVYVGDITYIPTNEGWLYLAVVIDIYSRKVVGWSMNYTLHTSIVNNALEMAIKRRNPPKGLIYHTDRGSQYASYEHKNLLEKHGIVQSMSKKGDCWDNAVAESFFHSLKTELIHHEKFLTRSQANEKIFEYIEIFYNRQRLHSSNGYMSPSEFEDKMLRLEMVS